MSLNNVHNIDVLKNILSDLYLKYGTTDETLRLSQLVDVLVKNQQNIIVKIRENEERFKNIICAASDMIFEIDINNNTLLYSREGLPYELSSINKTSENIYSSLFDNIANTFIHPNDYNEFKKLFSLKNVIDLIMAGKEPPYMDVRILKNNKYIWVTCAVTPAISKIEDQIILMVYAKNIHDKKLKELEMIRKTQRDPLTDLYNKSFTISKIENILTKPLITHYYLIIIDMDNFSLINKNLGHSFGDAVLQDISKKIRSVFKDADVIGRVGGDEFIVFTKEIDNKSSLVYKLDKLKILLKQSFGRNDDKVELSASMGISSYPEDGTVLDELGKAAQKALYISKVNTKDSYYFYDPTIHFQQNGFFKSSIDESNSQYLLSDINNNIFEYIFRILYETKDTYTAINLILKIIGEHFNINRVYIYELSEDCDYCCNTFEWCNEGVSPKLNIFKSISVKEFDIYSPYFDDNGLFFCNNINTLPPPLLKLVKKQNVKSFLQYSICDDGKFRGFVGFDECFKENRNWSFEEIKILKLVSNIVSTFLLKERSYNNLLKSVKINNSILDNVNSYTYAVDSESYELVFINKKIRTLIPHAKIGDKCYNVIFKGQNSPCKSCPIKLLKKSNNCTEDSIELYNEYYKLLVNSTASKLEWEENKGTYLIHCYDITKYKKTSSKKQ
ncbi:sensor domain-containing diguanylate cyclase [Clostridium septicum]|uniref:Sensor domain-containing diguanylate cyclase n=1 Tax=Clostridium septicum TaxID=1504 RepID=A0A9N7JKX4_CLOSE|nr:sensor domain-containing diguanylate cyclase [Clostridium septicum]AYE33771.1 hypothetical protein CP523_04420 [Clostridium septicum]QAS61929.1 sensor domain-containing diguanylate cyclase [Clostridium septicum]UEC21619.1 sensor domain-containing diguanylate cyclase [Clostridium septicum]USS00331.1 sensor domain-containing diguanylate cyclase [Clostridium septicum]